jgi:hypothetical protein
MSDTVLLAVIGVIGALINGVIAIYMIKVKGGQERAATAAEAARTTAVDVARRVKTVKETLEASTANTDKKLDVIHTLVNSKLGLALTAVADLKRREANRTRDPDDVHSAELAELALSEHTAAQKSVDADNG